ncbi:MAG: hypothetical protein V8Q82_02705 [Christensenellales bacterium]
MNRHELEEVFLSSQEVFHGKLINVEHWQVRPAQWANGLARGG